MKIVIAGPIPTQRKSGGVAVFDENVALTLARLNHNNQIIIATKSSNLVNKIYPENISLININSLKRIKKFNPDIIISSLWYSLFFCNKYIKATKIHILHGFTNYRDYSDWKVSVMHKIDKKIQKNYDYLLANSEFTKYINENIFGIKVNGTFRIGLSQRQINKLITLKNIDNKNILYVGRLVSAKNVDKAIIAVSQLKNTDYGELKIIGYGSEKEKLQHLAIHNKKIVFLGAVASYKVIDYYKKAHVFISLNPSEPFGITYEEAIAAGLYVIAPNTGGQVEFLKHFSERCSLVNINDISSIADAIHVGLSKKLNKLSKEEIKDLSYLNTVKQILGVISNDS